MITDEDLAMAFDRVARTPDGALIYRYLQKIQMGVLADPDPSDCALRQDFGKRTFAARLMGLMAKGIDESGGRTDLPGDTRASGAPVVFVTKPVESRRRLTPRQWIAEHDPEVTGALTAGSGE